jgi:hypothetical protein
MARPAGLPAPSPPLIGAARRGGPRAAAVPVAASGPFWAKLGIDSLPSKISEQSLVLTGGTLVNRPILISHKRARRNLRWHNEAMLNLARSPFLCFVPSKGTVSSLADDGDEISCEDQPHDQAAERTSSDSVRSKVT